MHFLPTNLSPTSGTLKLLSGPAGVSMVLSMLFVSYLFAFFYLISEDVRLIEHIASFSLFALLILFEEIQFSWLA